MKKNAIGTNFQKENIYLGTYANKDKRTIETLKNMLSNEMFDGQDLDQLVMSLVNDGVLSTECVDIFYKDENGYTRFTENGYDTVKGDNSDGKGIINNIVPIWDYYKEDEVSELSVNDNYIVVAVETTDALDKYNCDYNSNELQKHR